MIKSGYKIHSDYGFTRKFKKNETFIIPDGIGICQFGYDIFGVLIFCWLFVGFFFQGNVRCFAVVYPFFSDFFKR